MVKAVAAGAALMLLAVATLWVTTAVISAVAVYGLYRLARTYGREHRARRAAAEHARAELLARAELQHRWHLDGDPRGTYGRYTPAA